MKNTWEANWLDYYQILQVSPTAELAVIEAVYKKLVTKHHPDKVGYDNETIRQLNEAYEVLKNPDTRNYYDKVWREKSSNHQKESDSKLRFSLLVVGVIALIALFGAVWVGLGWSTNYVISRTVKAELSEIRVLVRQNDYDRALALCNKIIGADPIQAEALLLRGCIFSEKHDQGRSNADYLRSLELLDKAIGKSSTDPVAYKNRGEIYYLQGQYYRALEDMNTAIKLDGKYSRALGFRSVIFLAQGKKQEALTDTASAFKLDENYPEAWAIWGEISADRNLLDLAITAYDHALKLDGKFEYALSLRGKALEDKKMYEKALNDYDAALKLPYQNKTVFLFRGRCHYFLKSYDKALDDFDSAIKLDEKYADAYAWRGKLQEEFKHDFAAAKKDYKKSLQLGSSLDWVSKD